MEHKLIIECVICFSIGFIPGIILLILAGLSCLSDKWTDWQVDKAMIRRSSKS